MIINTQLIRPKPKVFFIALLTFKITINLNFKSNNHEIKNFSFSNFVGAYRFLFV